MYVTPPPPSPDLTFYWPELWPVLDSDWQPSTPVSLQYLLVAMAVVCPTTTAVTTMTTVETIVTRWAVCSDRVTPTQSSLATTGAVLQRTMFVMASTTAMTTAPLMSRTAVSILSLQQKSNRGNCSDQSGYYLKWICSNLCLSQRREPASQSTQNVSLPTSASHVHTCVMETTTVGTWATRALHTVVSSAAVLGLKQCCVFSVSVANWYFRALY